MKTSTMATEIHQGMTTLPDGTISANVQADSRQRPPPAASDALVGEMAAANRNRDQHLDPTFFCSSYLDHQPQIRHSCIKAMSAVDGSVEAAGPVSLRRSGDGAHADETTGARCGGPDCHSGPCVWKCESSVVQWGWRRGETRWKRKAI